MGRNCEEVIRTIHASSISVCLMWSSSPFANELSLLKTVSRYPLLLLFMASIFMRRSKLGQLLLNTVCQSVQASSRSFPSSALRSLPPRVDVQAGSPALLGCYNPSRSFLRCFGSIRAQGEDFLSSDDDENQVLDFPGGSVDITTDMKFLSECPEKRSSCYRVLDDNGQLVETNSPHLISEETSIKMYTDMVTLQTMDTIFYEAQRQGRISFYVTSNGEEAINIASAAALTNDDVVFPQYREPGVLLWRGFTLQEFANQCLNNKEDYGKGRQMPIHYGSSKHNYFTVSSPIGTQLPQAVGAAYSLKMDQKNACAVTYFGDGGTSEGDFHAALNFAAVTESPVIFICRNNGWAISTPTSEQFRSDGLVVRGPAYGIRSIRIDGNDALAIYNTVKTAREMAINEHKPIFIEALTYRAGHHSTSDDSTKYRPTHEIEYWRTQRDPVTRFRKWIEGNGWWNDSTESEFRTDVRKKILHCIQVAEKAKKPALGDLFTDVYSEIPTNLREQEKSLRATVARHPQEYPSDVPL